MTKKEKEIKEEFERKQAENIKLEQKISMIIWKMRQPKTAEEAEKIKEKFNKIIKILESE
jgi:hypothetical protein